MTEETNTADDLSNGEDPSPSTAIQSIMKGGSLFGKSASKANVSQNVEEKPVEIEESTSYGDTVTKIVDVIPGGSDENVNAPVDGNSAEETKEIVETVRGDGGGSEESHVTLGNIVPELEEHNGTTNAADVSLKEASDGTAKADHSSEYNTDNVEGSPIPDVEKSAEEGEKFLGEVDQADVAGDVADSADHVEKDIPKEVDEVEKKEDEKEADQEENEDVMEEKEGVEEQKQAEEDEDVEEEKEDVQVTKETAHDTKKTDDDKGENVEEAAGGKASEVSDEAMETEESVAEGGSGKKDEEVPVEDDVPEAMDIEEPCKVVILAPETVDEGMEDQEEPEDAKEGTEAHVEDVDAVKEDVEAAEEPQEEAEAVEETPTKTSKRAAATPSSKGRSSKKVKETKTPLKSQRRTRSAAVYVEESVEADSEKIEEAEEEPAKTPKAVRSTRRGAVAPKTPKTPTGKVSDNEEDKEEEEAEPAPRSLRTRAAKVELTPATPKAAGPRTTRGSAIQSEPKKIEEEGEVSVSSRSSKRAAAEKSTPAEAEVEKTPKTGRSKKAPAKADDHGETPKRSRKDSDADDPYDVTTQLDQHPEPFKNIHMKVQSFGEMRFNKVGSGKYTATEKTAEERVGNLPDMAPKTNERRSLAELTPGRKRGVRTSPLTSPTGSKRAAPARRKSSKADDSKEDMEVDEETTPQRGSSRKRKASPVAATPSKKAVISAPELTEDQQWEVDHPGDEGAHLEVGARVYAMFSKVFYPAIVLTERDAHGRYKVQFVEDKLVRDVPIAGLVPLRAVVAGKECFYDENGASVIVSPNAASAPEWFKGIFQIQIEDQEEVIDAEWSKISLDSNEWKEYIHQKSLEATAVAADNIASSKSRRSHGDALAVEVTTPVVKTPAAKSTKKTPKKETAPAPTPKSKKGKSAQKAEEEPEKEPEEEKNDKEDSRGDGSDASEEPASTALFKGMMFILTSAQRDGSSNFKKKLMSDFIQQSEGHVVEDFSAVDSNPDMEHFLISDTHYRTHKYLSAMARGVPCVSHEWILRCRESGTLVDKEQYLLPAGVSILDQETYPLPKNQAGLLKDKLVLVHSNNRPASARGLNFIQIWEPMVGLLGGQAITDVGDLGADTKIDIMLTDASASEDMLEKARADDALIVSSEWLIQGIIMDKLADPSAHVRFQFDGGVPSSR